MQPMAGSRRRITAAVALSTGIFTLYAGPRNSANYRIATDTWVVPYRFQEPGAPVAVYMNSMVIAGKEPVLVDCGPAVNRAA